METTTDKGHKITECQKHGYDSKKDAVTALNYRTQGRQKNRRNRPEKLRAYECKWCGKWHLTSLFYEDQMRIRGGIKNLKK